MDPVFDHEFEDHVIGVGYGHDIRRLDTLMLRVVDSTLPSVLFVDYSEVWIRYTNAHSQTTHVLTIELRTTSLHSEYLYI